VAIRPETGLHSEIVQPLRATVIFERLSPDIANRGWRSQNKTEPSRSV
jgi:hypothetical protein